MRKIISAVMAAALAFAVLPVAAMAESIPHPGNWRVTYTSDGKMTDNYSASEYVDAVSGLQPGDDITFAIPLSHENDSKADWYIANDVVKTLEENSEASGSAYEYRLTYTNPSGQVSTLYDSEVVGGDEGNGLADATNALEDYIGLGQLSKGQTAKVELRVALDGETEGNAYFDTLARLKLKFAVEPEPEPTRRTERRTVQTGDETRSRLFPLYVIMAVSGVALAGLATYGVIERRKEKREGVR